MVVRNKQYSVAEYFKQYVRVGNIMENILSFGNGQLEGTITLENGNLLIDFIGKALVEKAPKEMNSLIKVNSFNIDTGYIALDTNYGEKCIDLSHLFNEKGLNYTGLVDVAASKYVIKSVREILTRLRSEFSNLKVGYYAICENPWDSEIEYVIDTIDGSELNICDIFTRIIELQREYNVWTGMFWYSSIIRRLKLSDAGSEQETSDWIKEFNEKIVWL